jgi:glycosyltransferase involved in cell wall biosynthesis
MLTSRFDSQARPDSSQVTVIVPAFDEEEIIARIVERIRAVDPDYEIIVVDDGSSDRTAERAAAAGALVVSHPYNVGNGAAIKTGARRADRDVIVFLDGDGQHPPEVIPQLVEGIGRYDMVVAARTKECTTSAVRNFGNMVLNRLASWISGHPIDDLTSGFRAIKRERLLEFLHLLPNRYSYPTTLTISLLCSGYFVKWEPAGIIGRRTTGRSHISPVRDFARFLNIIVRITFLFRPHRAILPAGLSTFIGGIAVCIYQYRLTGGIHAAGIILLTSSIVILCFGIIAEQLAVGRRERQPTAQPVGNRPA